MLQSLVVVSLVVFMATVEEEQPPFRACPLAAVHPQIPVAAFRLVVIAVLFEGRLLVEDATLFGALVTEELVVDRPLLRGDLLRRRHFSHGSRITVSTAGSSHMGEGGRVGRQGYGGSP